MSDRRIALTRKAAVALGALTVYLRPKLAADAKLDLESVLQDVTAKNFKAKKRDIVSAIRRQVDGHLAKDAKLDTLAQLLDALEMEGNPAEAGGGMPEANPESGRPEIPTAKGPGMMQPMQGQGAPEHTGVTKDLPDPAMGGGAPAPAPGGGLGGGTGGAPIGMEQLKAFLASKGMHPADIEQACQMACGPSGPGAGAGSKAPPPAGGAAPPPAGGGAAPSAGHSPAPSGGGGGEKESGGGEKESSDKKGEDATGAFASPNKAGFAEGGPRAPGGGENSRGNAQQYTPGRPTPEMLDQEHHRKFEEHTPGRGANFTTNDGYTPGQPTPEMQDQEHHRKFEEHTPGRGANFTTNDSPPPFKGMPERPGISQDSADGDLNMADKRQIEEAVALAAKNAIRQAQDQMNREVKAAVERERETQRQIREAENDVRPYVGQLAQAFDSAEEIYRTALNTLGVKLEGVHPTAYKVILGLQPYPNSQRRAMSPAGMVASDSKGTSDFATRNPHAAKIEVIR